MIENGKAKILRDGIDIKIVVPSKKNYFGLLFGVAWLGGWFWGLKTVTTVLLQSSESSNKPIGFLTTWLIGWTIGGIAAIFVILWGFLGKETLYLNVRQSIFSKTVLGIGIKHQLETNEIKNFRYNQVQKSFLSMSRSWNFWGLGEGKLKFDYGMKTYSFGLSLDEAEINYLIEEIKKTGRF